MLSLVTVNQLSKLVPSSKIFPNPFALECFKSFKIASKRKMSYFSLTVSNTYLFLLLLATINKNSLIRYYEM